MGDFNTNFISNSDLFGGEPSKETQSLRNSLTVSSIVPAMTSIERKNYHLELNIEEERYSLPLIIRKSNIYKGMDAVVIENWRAFSELSTLIDEWFRDNSNIKTEEQFLMKEQPNIDAIGCPISKPGY